MKLIKQVVECATTEEAEMVNVIAKRLKSYVFSYTEKSREPIYRPVAEVHTFAVAFFDAAKFNHVRGLALPYGQSFVYTTTPEVTI